MWRIRLFGTLEIESPSGVISRFTGNKAGGVLACLALNLGNIVTREELADAFWFDSDPTKQRTRLRQEMLRLRTLFGTDATSPLQSAPQWVRLSSETAITDVAQFLILLSEAKRAVLPSEREKALSEAVALYRGDLLANYSDMAISERTSFAQSFEVAMRELAELRQSLGDIAGAEESLQRLLAYNPFLEEAHVDLMRLYAASGQPTKLRRQYAALQETLRDEMNVAPSETTRQLAEKLLESVPIHPSLSMPSAQPAPNAPVFATPSAAETESPWKEDAHKEKSQQSSRESMRRAGSRLRIGLACLLLSFVGLLVVNRLRTAAPPSRSSASPPLQYNQEKWKYVYALQPGEKGDAEPQAMICNNNKNYGYIYLTGLVQTDKEDADILTLQLSQDGKTLLGRARYSSPEHDCDRAYSIAQEIRDEMTAAIYVAGETYVPPSPGVQEGWRLVLIKYDGSLHQQWAKRSPVIVHNEMHNIRVAYSEDGGITVGATALENGVYKMLFLRYNRDGALLWQKRYVPPDAKSAVFSDMTTDSKGNVYGCGTALREVATAGSHTEWATICYDAMGNMQWERSNSGSGRGADAACRLSLSEREQFVYVFGVFYNGDIANGGSGTNLALAQYKLDGTPQWTRSDPKSGPEIAPLSIARNSRPDLITIAGTKPTPERNSAILLSQYDNAGNLRWSRQYAPPEGFKSARSPYLITMERDRCALLATLSNQSALHEHEHNQFLLMDYSITGVLQRQYAFKAKGEMHRPQATLFSQFDSSIIVGGQAQQEDGKMALVVLKY